MSAGVRVGVAIVAAVTAVAVALVVVTRDHGATAPRGVASPADLTAAGAAALALVRYDPSEVGASIRFAPGREDVRARANLADRSVTVYLRAGEAAHVVAHDIAHELGHLYDDQRLTQAARERYLTARGAEGGPWWPTGESDYEVGAGDFAEVFALCHASSPQFRSQLAPRPDNPCELLPQEAM